MHMARASCTSSSTIPRRAGSYDPLKELGLLNTNMAASTIYGLFQQQGGGMVASAS
jgi:hypothetical protein